MIRNLLAAWRYEPITQTEARARLKALTADLPKPRVIEAQPDARVRMVYVYRALRSVLPARQSTGQRRWVA